MQQDPFGRTRLMMCDAGSWARVAEAGLMLASAPSEELLQRFLRCFSVLLSGETTGQVAALSLALQLQGIPPVLRGAFPTERQMWKSAKTRQALIMADLLWLSSRGANPLKGADELAAYIRVKNYADALSTAFRMSYGLEALLTSRAPSSSGLMRKVLASIQPYRNELVIVPSLLARQEQKVEPGRIKKQLEDGANAASQLPDGGQQRQLDLGLVYRSLYAADCFVSGEGYAEASRYYNALAPAFSKRATRFYMRTLCERLMRDLPTNLTKPLRPTKPKGGAMV